MKPQCKKRTARKPKFAVDAPTEKLQKVLARAGLGSRREIEKWIAAGNIKVNDKIATLGDRVTTGVKIRAFGKLVSLRSKEQLKTRVILYYKPTGEICTRTDPQQRPTVFTNLPKMKYERWIMIGRLDVSTTGLLLFTNNGELAHQLMHPVSELEREYAVRIFGAVDKAMLERLRQGVKLEDGLAKFDAIQDAGGEGSNHWYHVILCEGRNREVRRLWESQGVKVSRLIRLRYANIKLPRNLLQGRWRELTPADVKELCGLAGYSDRE